MRHSICTVGFDDLLEIEGHIRSIVEFFAAAKEKMILNCSPFFFVARFPKKTDGVNHYVNFGYIGQDKIFIPIWQDHLKLQKIQGCNLNILVGIIIDRMNSLFILTKEPFEANIVELELYIEIVIIKRK